MVKRRQKLKQWIKHCYLRITLVPYNDAPVEEWTKFAHGAPRWLVEQTLKKWEKDVSAENHWIAVHDVLKSRCDCFEMPLLSKKFIETHKDQIFWVCTGASNKDILQDVWKKMNVIPMYVVEFSGKLRGIAVYRGLVLAGTLNVSCRSKECDKILQNNNARLLRQADALVLSEYMPRVCEMMQAADILAIEGTYWLAEEDEKYGRQFWDSESQCCAFLETQREAYIIGKL